MEETLINRTMPNSREAEQSVIGSMIMDKDAILTAMEMLISEDFYYKQYGILFDTMVESVSDNISILNIISTYGYLNDFVQEYIVSNTTL